MIIVAIIALVVTLVVILRYHAALLIDDKRKSRNGKVEITREFLNLSDGTSLKLLQNDPWDVNAVVIGIPSLLSTNKEFTDLSLYFEEKNIKFLSSDIREQNWEGNCNNLNLGTSLCDLKELIKEAKRIYPDKKVYLLGQSFGANIAYFLWSKRMKEITGLIILNPLISNSKINHWGYTQYTFFLETIKVQKDLQFIDMRKAIEKLKQQTNNSSYSKEIVSLWERKYQHGIPVRFIAQAQALINHFRKSEPLKMKKNLLFLTSSDFSQPSSYLTNDYREIIGNELVLTDYLNESVLDEIVKFVA